MYRISRLFALSSPELEILAITLSFGKIRLMDLNDVPMRLSR